MNKKTLEYFNGDELAAITWKKKYALDEETSPYDSYKRCAKEFARIERNYESDDVVLSEDLIYDLFINQQICLAGSVHAGLGNTKQISSLSNCFVGGQPYDSYGGILEKDELLVQLMKRRAGAGLEISSLRPNEFPVNNSAKTSTGPVSFAHRYSNTTNEVAQNNRRGALLLSIDIRHPDVVEFITSKQDLTKLTGANISVGIRDEFMKAVENDEDYTLYWPCNGSIEDAKITKTVRAKDVWDTLISCAHNTGEPGILFLDNHWDNSPDTVYEKHKGVCTNPCGEIFMSEYDTCRLIHINILKYVDNPYTDQASFNKDKFYEHCYYLMKLGDDLVDLEIEAINKIIAVVSKDTHRTAERELFFWKKIKQKALDGRRAGCGSLGWADAIAAMGYSYDSDESLDFIKMIAELKYDSELKATMNMGQTRGAFLDYDKDIDPCERRNISFNTVAPTGTTAMLAQVSAGIEPLFATHYTRNVTTNDDDYDFIDEVGKKFKKHNVYHKPVKDWLALHPDKTIEESPWYNSTADKIDWKKRVQFQSIIQNSTTHSISSTINLPKNTPKEIVDNIYMESWKTGLKGITVYVDGSRTGILTTDDTNNTKQEFTINHAPKRPKELDAHFYTVSVKGSIFGVIIGLYDNRPYEVFALPLNRRYKDREGKLIKVNKGKYDFKCKSLTIENINIMTENQKAITILVSLALRHSVDIPIIIKTISKASNDITDFTSAISRILKKYLVEGQELIEKCPECGTKLIFQNGCKQCLQCGYSGCN